MLVVEDAACKAGQRDIIRDFWYEFAPGERIGIVGPNGAGQAPLPFSNYKPPPPSLTPFNPSPVPHPPPSPHPCPSLSPQPPPLSSPTSCCPACPEYILLTHRHDLVVNKVPSPPFPPPPCLCPACQVRLSFLRLSLAKFDRSDCSHFPLPEQQVL